MTYSKIEQRTRELVEGIVRELGYIIYNIQYVKEGPHWYLRVFIDRDEGVSIDDCEVISKTLSPLLDNEDLIKENYFLEVSSPGMERELVLDWHFEKYRGERVTVKTNKTKFEGNLEDVTDEEIYLSEPEQIVPRKNVKYVRLKPDFNF